MCLPPALLAGWALSLWRGILRGALAPALPSCPVCAQNEEETHRPSNAEYADRAQLHPRFTLRQRTPGSIFWRDGSGGANVDLPGVPALFLAPKMHSLLQAFLGPEKHRAGLWLFSSGSLLGVAQPASVGRERPPCATRISPEWPRLPRASVFTTQLVLSNDCEGSRALSACGRGRSQGIPWSCPASACNQGLRENHRPVLMGGSVSEWVAVLESV